jgi:DNA-binding transcriptional regulator GbsR (MarR family)
MSKKQQEIEKIKGMIQKLEKELQEKNANSDLSESGNEIDYILARLEELNRILDDLQSRD